MVQVIFIEDFLGSSNIEHHCLVITVLCEPQLGKHGLYPSISTKNKNKNTVLIGDILTWSDGKHSLIEIAKLCGIPVWKTSIVIETLVENQPLYLSQSPVSTYIDSTIKSIINQVISYFSLILKKQYA